MGRPYCTCCPRPNHCLHSLPCSPCHLRYLLFTFNRFLQSAHKWQTLATTQKASFSSARQLSFSLVGCFWPCGFVPSLTDNLYSTYTYDTRSTSNSSYSLPSALRPTVDPQFLQCIMPLLLHQHDPVHSLQNLSPLLFAVRNLCVVHQCESDMSQDVSHVWNSIFIKTFRHKGSVKLNTYEHPDLGYMQYQYWDQSV